MAVVLPEPDTPLIRITRIFFTPPRPKPQDQPPLLHLAEKFAFKLESRIEPHPLQQVIPRSHFDDRREISARRHWNFEHRNVHSQEAVLLFLQSDAVILHLLAPGHQFDDEFRSSFVPGSPRPRTVADIDDPQPPDFLSDEPILRRIKRNLTVGLNENKLPSQL